MNTSAGGRRERHWNGLLPAIAAPLIALALIWLPFMRPLGALIEEWGILGLFQQFGVFYHTDSDGPMAITRLRPLNVLPMAVAYTAQPDSFVGWNAVLAAGLLLKALGMSYIAWWVTRVPFMAVLAGLLFLLYPADTMQMALRGIHINWAVSLTLCSMAMLLWATELRSLLLRLLASASAALLFLSGSLMYEAGLFLAPLPLLIWWARFGFREGLSRLLQQRLPLVAWLVGVGLAAGYLVVVSRSGVVYQQSVSADPLNTLWILASRLPLLVLVGLYRAFAHGWFDAAAMLVNLQRSWIYVASGLALVLVYLVSAPRTPEDQHPPGRGWELRWIVAGVVGAALGYLPYTSAGSHILITQRTYLYAAVGAAMAFAAMGYAFWRWNRGLGIALWCLLLTLGLSSQITQFTHYDDLWRRQRMLLSGLLAAVPNPEEGQRILIVDQSGMLSSTWMLRGELLGQALSFLHEKSVVPVTCLELNQRWVSFATRPNGQFSTCVETATDWQIAPDLTNAFTLPKAGLVKLVVRPDGRVELAEGAVDQKVSPAMAARWEAVLGCWPICAYERASSERFRYDFGTWWSLAEAEWGEGWNDAIWDVPSLDPSSSAWIGAEQARLWFQLLPQDTPYLFQMRLQEATRGSLVGLEVAINGHPLLLGQTKKGVVEGAVHPDWLKAGVNALTISAPTHPGLGTSVAVDWVEVAPGS